jgi:hypothetical protein
VAGGADGAVHLLDDSERAALQRLERSTIARAGLIGALSAGVAAACEVALLPYEDDAFIFWGVLGVVSGLCAVLEIVFLSIDALDAAHAQAAIAGAIGDDDGAGGQDDAREETFRVLARAALEIPNPRENPFALDPLKETSRWLLVGAALVYKLKVSATNIVLKQLVRRAMGRAALRATIVPFVAVPVTAAWNMIVCARVLRELRLRVLGPAAAVDVVARVLPTTLQPSAAQQEALVRAVGACVVRSADVPPNLVALMAVLMERLGLAALPAEVDASAPFLAALRALPESERDVVVDVLRAAAVIDGRLGRAERALLRDAGADVDIDAALRAFVEGLPLPVGLATPVFRSPHERAVASRRRRPRRWCRCGRHRVSDDEPGARREGDGRVPVGHRTWRLPSGGAGHRRAGFLSHRRRQPGGRRRAPPTSEPRRRADGLAGRGPRRHRRSRAGRRRHGRRHRLDDGERPHRPRRAVARRRPVHDEPRARAPRLRLGRRRRRRDDGADLQRPAGPHRRRPLQPPARWRVVVVAAAEATSARATPTCLHRAPTDGMTA